MKEKRESNFLYYSRYVFIALATIYMIYQAAAKDFIGALFTFVFVFIVSLLLISFEKIIDYLQKIEENTRK